MGAYFVTIRLKIIKKKIIFIAPCLRKSESISCGKKGKTGKKRCTSEGLKKIVEVINVPSSGCGNPENYGVSDNRYELWTKKKCAGNFTVSVCDTQGKHYIIMPMQFSANFYQL